MNLDNLLKAQSSLVIPMLKIFVLSNFAVLNKLVENVSEL